MQITTEVFEDGNPLGTMITASRDDARDIVVVADSRELALEELVLELERERIAS